MENNSQVNGESLVEELRTELQEIDAMEVGDTLLDLKHCINVLIKPCLLSTVFNI